MQLRIKHAQAKNYAGCMHVIGNGTWPSFTEVHAQGKMALISNIPVSESFTILEYSS